MRILLVAATLCFACTPSPDKVNQDFLNKAAANPGAVMTSSGLVYQDLVVGSGASPSASSTVGVHYTGKLIDGSVFDQSGGQTISFQLDQVIPCWTEGLQRMRVGGTARLVCPPGLAYGSSSVGSIPPNSVLDFQVDLVSVNP